MRAIERTQDADENVGGVADSVLVRQQGVLGELVYVHGGARRRLWFLTLRFRRAVGFFIVVEQRDVVEDRFVQVVKRTVDGGFRSDARFFA